MHKPIVIQMMIESILFKHAPKCGGTVAIDGKHYYIQRMEPTPVDDDGFYCLWDYLLEPMADVCKSYDYSSEDFHAIALGEPTITELDK